jgi:hypothetical protein
VARGRPGRRGCDWRQVGVRGWSLIGSTGRRRRRRWWPTPLAADGEVHRRRVQSWRSRRASDVPGGPGLRPSFLGIARCSSEPLPDLEGGPSGCLQEVGLAGQSSVQLLSDALQTVWRRWYPLVLATCKCWQSQLEVRAFGMASGLLCELGGSSVRMGIEGCTPLERGLS